DLEARKYLGRPISGFTYCFGQHGPFDSGGFFGALAELKTGEFITENQIPCGEYVGYEMLPTRQAPEFDFSPSEAEVLRYVAPSRCAGWRGRRPPAPSSHPVTGAARASRQDHLSVPIRGGGRRIPLGLHVRLHRRRGEYSNHAHLPRCPLNAESHSFKASR